MKKSVAVIITIMLALVMVVSAVGVALADKENPDGTYKGNGAPSGPHYNLNIIGMENIDNKADMECGNGHRIFVPLNGKSKIMLTEGQEPFEFQVVDCVATNNDPAEFMLPNPDPDDDGVTAYSVFLRVLGKPGGDIIMDTCATDPLTGEVLCSDEKVVKVRETGKGKQRFDNVSKELLYVYAWVCTDVDAITGDCTAYEYMRVPLFSDKLEDYLWQYDNNGVRIAQLRFYEIPTTVPDPVPPAP